MSFMYDFIFSNCKNRLGQNPKYCEYICKHGQVFPFSDDVCMQSCFSPAFYEISEDKMYSCIRMADLYCCRYSNRYASELIHAFLKTNIVNQREIKVLSLGCGPCNDMLALDYLINENELGCQSVKYVGIDYCDDTWKTIHDDIKNYQCKSYLKEIDFVDSDLYDFMPKLSQSNFSSNLIVLNYVFSDMAKRIIDNDDQKILNFLENLTYYYKNLPECTIVVNDINTDDSNGGRQYFCALLQKLGLGLNSKNVIVGHFDNKYGFGNKFLNNSVFFSIDPLYQRNVSVCNSAQLIIN